MDTGTYTSRRSEIEHYFDRTAASAWARLTSDAPVGRIRATVRAGRDRMRNTLADVYDRVLVLSSLPNDKYLGLLDAADVVLDSYPFGGYTTSLECFGMGIPVITLPHPLFAGRCTYGFYKLMNITDLVASTRDEYVNLAVRLANDKEFNRCVLRARAEIVVQFAHEACSG